MSGLAEAGAEILRSIHRLDPAFVDDDHPRAKHLHLGENMGGEQDRVVAAEVADEVADEADLVRIKSDGGFIKDEEVRFVNHRVGQSHALPEALRESPDDFFSDLIEAAHLENIAHALGESAVRHALQSGSVAEKFTNAHIEVERNIFRQVADMLARLERLGKNIEARDAGPAGGGGQIACEHPHRGGFAGAIRAQESHDLALLHGKVDPVHCGDGTEAFGELFDLDHEAANLNARVLRVGRKTLPAGPEKHSRARLSIAKSSSATSVPRVWRLRLGVRTQPSQGWCTGSNPVGAASFISP